MYVLFKNNYRLCKTSDSSKILNCEDKHSFNSDKSYILPCLGDGAFFFPDSYSNCLCLMLAFDKAPLFIMINFPPFHFVFSLYLCL